MSKYLDKNGLQHLWGKIRASVAAKQDKLTGTAGQVVGFDAQGRAVAQGTEKLVGPPGPKGDTGATGAKGATGPAGPGLPTGGTAGQVAVKKSGTDYDTQWKTLAASDVGAATMAQVNTAISAAITGAMNASY